MLWEFHLNLKNCTCQCLYCVLWISGWQRSWDSVRRGNLPNVTEVKRKKKKKKKQDAHPSLLLAPDFWVWLPTQKFRAALNPHLFHPALLCHVSEGTDDNISGRDPFLAWVKTPSSVCWAFCHHRSTKYSKRLVASQHKDDNDLCHHSWRKWLFITLFKCHLPLWGPREARY